EETLAFFSLNNTPVNTMRKISDHLTVQNFRQLGESKLNFEVTLLRKRDTQEWFAIKGEKSTFEIKPAGPLYLFDLFIHSHPRDPEPIPSSGDLILTLHAGLPDATACWIIGERGMTRFNVWNIKDPSVEWKDEIYGPSHGLFDEIIREVK